MIFSNLAAKIFANPDFLNGIEEDKLEHDIIEYFSEIYENKSEAYRNAKALIDFITGRAWVMSEVGDGLYAFTHQTFL